MGKGKTPSVVGKISRRSGKTKESSNSSEDDIPEGLNYPGFKKAYIEKYGETDRKTLRKAWEKYAEMSVDEEESASGEEGDGSSNEEESAQDEEHTEILDKRIASTLFPETADNVIFSPFSIVAALALAREGAKGDTLEELSSFLGISSKTNISDIMVLHTPDGFDVSNRVWVRNGIKILKKYTDAIEEIGGSVQSIKFDKSGLKTINSTVSEDTEGYINGLVPQLEPSSSIILVNAVYFKGKWLSEFETDDTMEETFITSNKKKIKVMKMIQTNKFDYAEIDGYQLLIMSYKESKGNDDEDEDSSYEKSGSPRALFILPKTVTGKPLPPPTENDIHEWLGADFSNQRVTVKLPRYELARKVELSDELQKLGVTISFTDEADFTGMTKPPTRDQEVKIDAIYHDAMIKVDEEGTIAAAATAVVMKSKGMSAKPKKPIVFDADHPFYFFLLTGNMIMFAGKVENPELASKKKTK